MRVGLLCFLNSSYISLFMGCANTRHSWASLFQLVNIKLYPFSWFREVLSKCRCSAHYLFKVSQDQWLVLHKFFSFFSFPLWLEPKTLKLWLHRQCRCSRATSCQVISPNHFTVHLFDPHVTRLYQAVPAWGSRFQNGHSAGLKASLMIPGPLTLPLTKLLWKMS